MRNRRPVSNRFQHHLALGAAMLAIGTAAVFQPASPRSGVRSTTPDRQLAVDDVQPTNLPEAIVGSETIEQQTADLVDLPPASPGVSRASAFPVGWYDSLLADDLLPEIADEGMGAVMPYDSPNADLGTYLDAARRQGIEVLVEIPRRFVKAVDRGAVAAFVGTYRDHPAVHGWYLADEPSMNRDLGPLAPHDARSLYESIRSADGTHPVAIAFGGREDPTPYRPAMDVLMFDRYPCWVGQPEFSGLATWTRAVREAARTAATEDGFVPIIQAYAHRDDEKLLSLHPRHRLPTPAEARYMAFTAVQSDATGMFFWARYRSDPAWIGSVLRPIATQLRMMRSALGAGEVPGLADTTVADVEVSAFRDPIAGVTYVIAVNHGERTVTAPIALDASVADVETVTLLADPPQELRVERATIDQTLGPFAVNVFRLGS